MEHHVQQEGAGHAGHGSVPLGGLLVSQDGYTLAMKSNILRSGRQAVVFELIGPLGKALTEYTPVHEKEVHFMAIRRDMAGFQHVHPTMDQFGTWSVDVDLDPGDWRFFADFQPPNHAAMTLGIDASVAGVYEPRPLPEVSQIAQTGRYTVTLQGEPSAAIASELTFSIVFDGHPVTTLEPYLGAFGHLVALRSGDLAYLHVHPQGEPGDGTTRPGPEISFFATAPSAGLYRLHLDFQHEGTVRSAHFTVAVAGTLTESDQAAAPVEGGNHGGHPDH